MNSQSQQLAVELLDSHPAPLPFWKRSLDVTCSVFALFLLAPIAMTIALATKFNSRGPVLFKQKRVGYRGNEFYCYKFRTMKVNAETSTHQAHFTQLMQSNAPMIKMDAKGDARLIPGGKWLRASGLDELPQIINVLKGEMSLVGPRPCLPYEYAQYTAAQKQRLASVPGLTGLWQVSGKNHTTFDEMIRLDVRYGHTKSLLLDLKIMCLTPFPLMQQIAEAKFGRFFAASAPRTATASPAPQIRSARLETAETTALN